MSLPKVLLVTFLAAAAGAQAASAEAKLVGVRPTRVTTSASPPQLRGTVGGTPVTLVVVWGGEPRVTLEASDDHLLEKLKGGAVTLETAHRPGAFRTRAFSGERWKCVEATPGKWVTRNNDELVQLRLPVHLVRGKSDAPYRNEESVSAWNDAAALPDGTTVLRLSLPQDFWAAMPPVSALVTDSVIVRVTAGHETALAFEVPMDKPFKVPPAVEEMLRQYRKNGPVTARKKEAGWVFSLVRKDLCGDGRVITIDFSQVDLLAFPTPEWRLSHKAGWIFADRVPLPRPGPVQSLNLGRLPTTQMTFLGERYEVSLLNVDVRDGGAVATFETGDFSGCFGAGCGEPVDVKDVFVTFKDGKLSSKVTKREED